MIEMVERALYRRRDRQAGAGRAFDHDHLDAKLPRRLDFRIGGAATAVFGDERIDLMVAHQPYLVVQPKWSEVADIGNVRYRESGLDRIDAAYQVVVHWRSVDMMRFLPANRQEDVARGGAEGGDDFRHVADRHPAIAFDRLPGRSAERESGQAGSRCRFDGVAGHLRCEGMRRVDQYRNLFFPEITGEPLGATEAAYADGNRLRQRIHGTPGKGNRRVEIGPRGKRRTQQSRFGRPAQDQNAGLAHA